jgi:hypothetical protein
VFADITGGDSMEHGWNIGRKIETRFRVFEKRLMRKMYGAERQKVTRGCKSNNEELHNLYPSFKSR